MIYWHFRNLQCIVAALFKSRISPSEIMASESIVKTFWANPFDSDWLNSIQAGRFFTYTDAARWEIAVRLGFLKLAMKKKLVVIVGGQKIINRRPVRIFRRFKLVMRITGWDDRWMYVSHYFEQNGKVATVVFSKIGMRSSAGLYSPKKAMEELGYSHMAPENWILKTFCDDLKTLGSIAERM